MNILAKAELIFENGIKKWGVTKRNIVTVTLLSNLLRYFVTLLLKVTRRNKLVTTKSNVLA